MDKEERIPKVGRPVKFETPEAMEEAINAYLASCWEDVPVIGMYGPLMVEDEECEPVEMLDKEGKPCLVRPKKPLTEFKQVRPYTVTGLARAIGMTRQSLLNYQEQGEFFDTVIHAKEICQQFAEEQLFLAKNPGGSQFSLMNNWNWRSKSEQDMNVRDVVDLAGRAKRARERVNGKAK